MDQQVQVKKSSRGVSWLRLLGPLALAWLLWRLDLHQIAALLAGADWRLVGLAAILILPLIALKTIRWLGILRAQGIRYYFRPAFIAYFASLFVGFVTPGRLGEFTKAFYVWSDCHASPGVAFSGVLADRLFDLLAVVVVSILALLGLGQDQLEWLTILGSLVFLAFPLFLFLNQRTYTWIQSRAMDLGRMLHKAFSTGGWVDDTRQGLIRMDLVALLQAAVLTLLAYLIYFWQANLLAQALGLPINFWQATCAVALGGLVTLLPVSISGLGTREATMVAYLGQWGISAELALSFSLLVFVTFYLFGGLLGALAWWIRPTPLRAEPFESGAGDVAT